MSVPNFHAKLASLVELDASATESQLLEAVRNQRQQRDAYREMAQAESWRSIPMRWAKIDTGAMIEHEGKVWIVLTRSGVEGRRVVAQLWRNGKTFRRFYGLDDVATVLEPTAWVDVMKLLRAELGAEMMTPEEIAELKAKGAGE